MTLGSFLHLPEASGARPAIIVLHGWQSPGTNGADVVDARAARFARLTITLQPIFPQPEGAVPSGSLRIAWGLAEYSADWRMLWP